MSPGVSCASGSLSSGGEIHAHLSGLSEQARPSGLAQGAQVLAHHLGVHRPLRHGTSFHGRPCRRVAGRVEGEDVVEGAGRGVSLSECVAESPGLAQRGDQRGVAVLLVVHRARFDPRRHDDGGYPVAGAVEGEAELAGRRRWIWRRDWPRRDMVVGASRLVPSDQQRGVPDVCARFGGGGPVGVVHPLQEGLTRQHRGRAVHREVNCVRERAAERRVVVTVAPAHVRLDEREVRQCPSGGVLLELCEGHEVGGQPVLQTGVVDHARETRAASAP